jgi:hypothetical protein
MKISRMLSIALLLALASAAQAQLRVDQLSNASAISDTDKIPWCQGCNAGTQLLAATGTQLWTWTQGHLAAPGAIGGTTPAAGSFTTLTATTGALTLGASGTLGSVAMGNATSGVLTLQPVTGALGTITVSLPAATDTLVGKATTDTLTNKTISSSTDTIGGVTMTLGSDATGDMYYRAAGGALTRLAVCTGTNVVGASGGLPACVAQSGGGLTIGTTTIASGTSTRFLYDLAGVVQETAGWTWDSTNQIATLNPATFTTLQSALKITPTWNNAGIFPGALLVNVTNTSSSPSSLLFDFQVGAVSQISFSRSGNLSLGAAPQTVLSQSSLLMGGNNSFIQIGARMYLDSPADAQIRINNNAGTNSFILTATTASATPTMQLGAANAASPVAQIVATQGSRAGTDTNVGGANLTIQAGTGTGTGTASSLILQSPILVGSGTGAQTQTTGLTIKGGMAVMAAYTVSTLPTGITGAIAYVTDAVACTFLAALTGGGSTVCPVFYNGTAWVGA